MTKKKEKQPRGRPSKKSKEIFKDESSQDKPEITPAHPVIEAPKEEKLQFQKPEPKAPEKTTCGACKGELDEGKKPKFCPNCGIELNWGA